MTNIAVLASSGQHLDSFHLEIMARWRELGHQVVSGAGTESRSANHSVLRSITRRPELRNVGATRELDQWIKESRSDILLTNTAVASFLARTRQHKYPVVYFCHGLHWNSGQLPAERLWQLLERSVLRNTSGVVVLNHDDELWFQRHAPTIPLLRLPYGVGLDLSTFPEVPATPMGDELRLLWAGEFYGRKRPQLALRVIAELRTRGVNATIQMCGKGPLFEETRHLATELRLGDSVEFPGHQPDIPRRLAESHALLMTSEWEGLPRIGLESVAVGRPVFAFDVKGTRSLPGVILAPDEDVSALATRVIQEVGSHAGVDRRPKALDQRWVADELVSFLGAIA